MISFNSQVTKGDYRIQIYTDNRKQFELIQEIVRLMIDKGLYEKLYMEQQESNQSNLSDYSERQVFPK